MGGLLRCISMVESTLVAPANGCSSLFSWLIPNPFLHLLSPMPVPSSSLGCSFGIGVKAKLKTLAILREEESLCIEFRDVRNVGFASKSLSV